MPPLSQPAPAEELPAKLELSGVVLDESSVLRSRMLPYVRMLVSLVEGVEVSHAELVHLLQRGLRQHSIAFRRRRDYVLAYLHQHPP